MTTPTRPGSAVTPRLLPFLLSVLLHLLIRESAGQSYVQTRNVSDTLLASSRYRTDTRPLLDQSQILFVDVSFRLVSIVAVNDVTQSFICNGFLALAWSDQLMVWDPTEFGGTLVLHPLPVHIWRPRLVLLNTMDKRDLFEDDPSPITTLADGSTLWIPGGLFRTSCELNLLKYPFDKQRCSIQMLPMALGNTELQFVAGLSGLEFYSTNGEWALDSTNIMVSELVVDTLTLSSFEVTFDLTRRPTFVLLNIVLPVTLLSLLNLMVFTIPADSGEKISYGITVVLAMSVFLSIVSSMLPNSSDTVPLITIYLFILLIVSVLTVIDAIVIVFIFHLEEKTENTQRVARQFSQAKRKVNLVQRAFNTLRIKGQRVTPPSLPRSRSPVMNVLPSHPSSSDHLHHLHHHQQHSRTSPSGSHLEMPEMGRANGSVEAGGAGNKTSSPAEADCAEPATVNRYRIIGKYIDAVSFIAFLVIWVVVTMWFFIATRA